MRTGAIFARGSCRALKWMALVGVVFALGAGSAAAQITTDVGDDAEVTEGSTKTITFTAKVSIPAASDPDDDTTHIAESTATITVALDTTADSGNTAADSAVRFSTATLEFPGNATDEIVEETVTATLVMQAHDEVGNGENVQDEVAVLAYTLSAIEDEDGVTVAILNQANPRAALAAPENDTITIKDREEQSFTLGLKDEDDAMVTEGGPDVTLTLTAAYPIGPAAVTVYLSHGDSPAVMSLTETVEFAADATGDGLMKEATLKLKENDGNDVDDTVTIRALTGTTPLDTNEEDSVEILVKDKTPTPEEDYVTPKSIADIDAAVAAARGRVDDSNGKWMVGDDDIMIDLDDLFNLPDASTFTITAEAMSDDDDLVMATASAAGNNVTVMAVDSGTATVTVIVNANMKPSSATTRTQSGRNSASLTFDVTVDPPAPREPRALTTDAAIKEISISDAEKRRIGGVERLHIDEGDRVEVTMMVEWSVGQLRDLYDNSPGTPDPVVIEFWADPEHDSADWLSPLDLSGDSQDFRGGSEGEITIKIPKMPKETQKDFERVSAKGSDRLNVLEDDDAEDEAFTIDVQNSSMGVSLDRSNSQLMTDTIVIDDDETQGIKIKRTTKGVIYESGDDQEFEVSADPALVDLMLEIDFDLEKADGSAVPRAYGVSPSSETIAAGEKAMVSIDIDENDGNRVEDELELHAQIDSRNRSMDVEDASFKFTVLDVHMLPKVMVSPQTGSVNEGEEIELTLTINRNPPDTIRIDGETLQHTTEPIDVMLSMGAGTTAGMGDYTLPSKVTFPEKKKAPWTQEMKVKVMATEDNDLDDGEMLVLDAMVAGTVAANGEDKMSQAAVSTLTIGESTGKLVWARSPEEVEAAVMAAKKAGMGDDMMFTAGEMIELEGNDLFGSAQGVTVGYTAMVEGDAVSESVSGGVVTITADSMGMAKVTITARASRPSGAVMINDQTDPREASITIALEVGLVALSVELSGPEDMNMNLVEGGMGGMVTATANRDVTENTVVNLMRDRAMSSAEDADFTAEPITIMAGQMKGSTMVMAVEDDMNEGNMAEELVLYGMVADNAGEVTGDGVKFYLWDAAVPALPVIAQLLLAAFLALGGYRRYRRR